MYEPKSRSLVPRPEIRKDDRINKVIFTLRSVGSERYNISYKVFRDIHIDKIFVTLLYRYDNFTYDFIHNHTFFFVEVFGKIDDLSMWNFPSNKRIIVYTIRWIPIHLFFVGDSL